MKLVIDASVATKWVLNEEHAEASLRVLAAGFSLHAPSHWLGEVGTALWSSSAVRRELTQEACRERYDWVLSLDIAEEPIRRLAAPALSIAFDLGLTVYDALYIALSKRIRAPLVTADRKLRDRVARQEPGSDLVLWIEDVP